VPANPVLLLHGQPGLARDWDRVVAAIGDRAEAIAIDRPGWGGAADVPTGVGGNASAALAALDGRGIERATIVGHSFGGAVAAWLAAHHPQRVASLVLVAPSANADSLLWLDRWLATPAAGYLASVGALGALGLALAADPVRRRLARELGLEERYLRAAAHLLTSPAAWRAFFVEQRALIRELPLLEAALDRIVAPTSIVSGAADRIVPVAASRRLARQIPGAELVLVERAGHLLPLRHGERLAELILAALPAQAAQG
jgi:pimeloyl-ACP methyl ester carboxylesterase